MALIEKINLISEEAKNQFKPDLKKYGRNFRAISESAVLEVLNPLLKKYKLIYEVEIKQKELHIEKIKAGRDSAGNLIEKLVFIADCVVRLCVHDAEDEFQPFTTFEGWGSGVDAGDKATGKALTAAVKYALFKGFRLQYSDDPDAEASEDIENLIEEFRKLEKNAFKIINAPEKKESKAEPLASEAQLNFIRAMVKDNGISDESFKKEFGFFPYEEKIPMRKAREMIEKLKNWTPFD